MKSLAVIALLGVAYGSEDNELYGSSFLRKPYLNAPLKAEPTHFDHHHQKFLHNDLAHKDKIPTDNQLHRPVFVKPIFKHNTTETNTHHENKDENKEQHQDAATDNHLYRPVFIPKFNMTKEEVHASTRHRPVFIPKFNITKSDKTEEAPVNTRSHTKEHSIHKKVADNHLYRPVFIPKFNSTKKTDAVKHAQTQLEDDELMNYEEFFKMAMEYKDTNMTPREHNIQKRPRLNANIIFDDHELYGGGPSLRDLNNGRHHHHHH